MLVFLVSLVSDHPNQLSRSRRVWIVKVRVYYVTAVGAKLKSGEIGA